MKRYGQLITWGTLSAPQLFTGQTRRFSARDDGNRELITDMSAENMAMVLNGLKTELNFEAMVTAGSTNFLDLSTGAAIALSGFSTGMVLCSRATETWRLNQPKTCAVQATHFPGITATTDGAAGELDAFTPDQSALTIVQPGQKLVYGTFGLEHAAGVVHGLTIDQILQLIPDDLSPDGKYLGCTACGYERNITLEILAKAAKPAVGSLLEITGAPAHAADYRITSSEKTFEDKRGMMYQVQATWIPAFSE